MSHASCRCSTPRYLGTEPGQLYATEVELSIAGSVEEEVNPGLEVLLIGRLLGGCGVLVGGGEIDGVGQSY
jgi:hypothetical protein